MAGIVTLFVLILIAIFGFLSLVAEATSLPGLALRGRKKAIERRIARRVNLNAAGKNGRLALHCAASRGHREIVELLLANGARVNKSSPGCPTALSLAAGGAHTEVCESLVAHGANVQRGAPTPLHSAAGAPRSEVGLVQLLLDHGAAVNSRRDVSHRTPLHRAAEKGHTEIARVLLTHGADMEAKDDKGLTPLNYAAERRHEETAELLRQWGRGEHAGQGATPTDAAGTS